MVLPLFILEDEHSFKHGGWLGKYFMLSKVLRSKKKEKKRKKEENRRMIEKEEKKRRIKCSLAFLASLIFQVTLKNYSKLKSSNHVQSDNENFICVSGSSICHLHMVGRSKYGIILQSNLEELFHT